MCYAKSNFPWMCNKTSDLTYNLNVISYQLSMLEAQTTTKSTHKYSLQACKNLIIEPKQPNTNSKAVKTLEFNSPIIFNVRKSYAFSPKVVYCASQFQK